MGLFSNKPKPGPGAGSANARAAAAAGHQRAATIAGLHGRYDVQAHHETQRDKLEREQKKLNRRGR